MDFLEAIKAEIADIEESLRADPDPRMVKLQELQRLLALYGVKNMRRLGSQRQELLEAVRHILAYETIPMKTSEIYNRLQMAGVAVPGRNPLNNLSSALCYFKDEFEPHGRSGWSIKRKA